MGPATVLNDRLSRGNRTCRTRWVVRAALIACLCVIPALAVDYTWQGNEGVYSGNWSDSSNWSPNGVPGTSGADTATIDLTGVGTYTVTLDASQGLNSVTLDSADATLAIADTFTLTVGGGTLQRLGGTITIGAASKIRLVGNVTYDVPLGITAAVGSKMEITEAILAADSMLPNPADVEIKNQSVAHITTHLVNQTTFEIQGALYFTTFLLLDDDTTLEGGGTIWISSSKYGYISGVSGARLTNQDNTIQGSGYLGNDAIQLTNHGIIESTRAGYALNVDPIDAGTMFNTGTIQTNGGSLNLLQGTYDNTGGIIQSVAGTLGIAIGADVSGGTVQATNGTRLVVSGGTVSGGTAREITTVRAEDNCEIYITDSGVLGAGGQFETVGTGRFELHNAVLPDGLAFPAGLNVTLPGDGGSTALIMGHLINETTIELYGSLFNTAAIMIDGDATLSGGGAISLANNNYAYITGTGGQHLNNADNTIHGAGYVGNDMISITNNGIIESRDFANHNLIIDPIDTGMVYNTGTIQTGPGGHGVTLQSGMYDNSGGMIQAVEADLTIGTGADVSGGTIRGTNGRRLVINGGTVSAGSSRETTTLRAEDGSQVYVTNWGTFSHEANLETTGTGQFTLDLAHLASGFVLPAGLKIVVRDLDDGAQATIDGLLINHTDFEIMGGSQEWQGAALVLEGDTTLQGSGAIILGPAWRSYLTGSGSEHLINQSTIRGNSGRLGNNSLVITNENLIDTDSGGLTVDPADGSIFVNSGTLQANLGGTLNLSAATYDNSAGIIQALNGSVVSMVTGVVVQAGVLDSDGSGYVNCNQCTLDNVTVEGSLEVADPVLVNHLTVNGIVDTNGGTLTVPTDVCLGGTGEVIGNVDLQGDLAPGSSFGTLDIQGDYSQDSGGELTIEVSQSQQDLLQISGTATLGGTLRVVILGDPPPPGTQFTVLTASTITGQFHDLNALCGVTADYSSTAVTITIDSNDLDPPDFDDSGRIDIIDFVLHTEAYGTCTGCQEDRNCDGNIDVDDVTLVVSYWTALVP